MKKITIIDGKYHEEEVAETPSKVKSGKAIIFGTGGSLSGNDAQEFKNLFWEPNRYFRELDAQQAFERQVWGIESAAPVPSEEVRQDWRTVESGPIPSIGNSGLSLAGALIGAASTINLTNVYNVNQFPLTQLTGGMARDNDTTAYEYLNSNREFAILKSRRRGASSMNQNEIMRRMYAALDPYLTQENETNQPETTDN